MIYANRLHLLAALQELAAVSVEPDVFMIVGRYLGWERMATVDTESLTQFLRSLRREYLHAGDHAAVAAVERIADLAGVGNVVRPARCDDAR